MKYSEYKKNLTSLEKLSFSIGRAFEKLSEKVKGYQQLKEYRIFLSNIKKLGFTYKVDGGHLIISNNDTLEVVLRRNGSDFMVFNQVFVVNEYKPVIDFIVDNKIQINNIVDAGSNIGLTAVKLSDVFTDARIICIEPDPQNYQCMKHNMKKNTNSILLQNALWNKEDDLFLDFGFRDGKDWSRAVTIDNSSSNTKVRGISLSYIMKQFALKTIDLLKIDIEGSERYIFNREDNLAFLDLVKVIAIEIHDEFNCREDIYDILTSRNFILFNTAETTIAINKTLL